MRRVVSTCVIAVLISCHSNPTSNTHTQAGSDSTIPSATQDNTYAYPISYSSNFVMGDSKNCQAVLNIWKAWESGDLSKLKDYYADSVELHFWDGTLVHNTRDSAIAAAQTFRNTLTGVRCSVAAVTAIKSKEKDENWALFWGTETLTFKDGKTDSSFLQETWRFNKDGKADLMYQYAEKPNVGRK